MPMMIFLVVSASGLLEDGGNTFRRNFGTKLRVNTLITTRKTSINIFAAVRISHLVQVTLVCRYGTSISTVTSNGLKEGLRVPAESGSSC